MPISSGAAGRVDVGIDTSIAWTPDGVKKEAKPVHCDSYLSRYMESLARKKKHNGNIIVQEGSEQLARPDGEVQYSASPGVSTDPHKQQKNGRGKSERISSGIQSNKSLVKSKTCTVL
ncbi:hypothetical protein DPEC_G00122860 [Dallia pectoralis]|uniref:Uncharacterized protein n=1 Tax=Dallia pectoralis TaxID=75939 RepID=A0ACC2GR41_DALPE|nr:hypothetical protein DPEC_G00122860 [Dallia pectoralis]